MQPPPADRISARLTLALLVLLVVAAGAVNYLWLTLNTVPPHWDAANHMTSALRYHEVLSQCYGNADWSLRRCAGELVYVDNNIYAPLFAFTGGLTIFLAGSSVTALTMTNLPYLAILIVSMYLLGSALHSRLAGLLAALIVLAYPLVLQSSREFMLEAPMLGLTGAAAYFLIASERFRKPAPTVLFGLTLGLGALAKFTFLTFMAGPGVYVFGALVVDIVRRRIDPGEASRRLAWLAAALALGAIVAGLWYWPHRQGFADALRTITALDTTRQSPFAPASLFYYVRAMPWEQMGLPLFLLFIYGLARFGSRVTKDHAWFLIVWLASIYLIHSVGTFKTRSNDIGILLPTAIVTAVGVAGLGRMRHLAVAVVAVFACVQIAVFTLPAPVLASRLGTFGWVDDPGTSASPRPEDWKVEQVLRGVGSRPGRIAIVTDHIFINGTTFDFYRLKNNLPVRVTPCWRVGPQGTDPADFSGFDMVIAKSDNGWVKVKADGCFRGPNGREEYATLVRRLEGGMQGFALMQSVPLPDGSSLLVFGVPQAAAQALHRPVPTAHVRADQRAAEPLSLRP